MAVPGYQSALGATRSFGGVRRCWWLAGLGLSECRSVSARALYEKHSREAVPRRQMGEVGQ